MPETPDIKPRSRDVTDGLERAAARSSPSVTSRLRGLRSGESGRSGMLGIVRRTSPLAPSATAS